jgi:hypothetical protein
MEISVKAKTTFIEMLFISLIVAINPANAKHNVEEADKEVYKIILVDKSSIIGTIITEDEAKIVFETLSHVEMVIPRDQIRNMRRLYGDIVKGEYVQPDPNRTRLFLAPTARPLKHGQGYFSIYEIFFPMLAVGVTNYVNLAAGVSLVPGVSQQLLYLAPKVVPLQLKYLDLAAGILYIIPPGSGTDKLGITYGMTTVGDKGKALTLGLGWGFAEGETNNKPVFLLGGEIQVSNNLKLVTENWFPPDSDYKYLTFGFRFFGEKLAADLAFIHPLGADMGGFPFVPWIGFVVNF